MEGWKCPVCGKGVAPTEKYCDHAVAAPLFPVAPARPLPYYPPIFPWNTFGGCDACRASGVCNCVRPGRGPTCTVNTAGRNVQ